MFKLIIEDDEGKKTVVPLIRDEITIGRKEGNTIRLTERNVSRRHAKLLRHNGAVFIEDLQSYNGIKVNGSKIAGRVAVAEGDRIQIGDYLLGLRAEGEQERPVSDVRPDTVELPRMGVSSPDTEATTERPAAQSTASTAAGAHPHARLVCVSSNFAGLEAVLNKPVTVIGRTPDNDVVVNHRSISRHHAQIVEENGRYTVMDMQSVNGVRVNGEEYGKVELRRGDLADLGHVRLRFVAPGEPFNFATDATIFDMSHASGARSTLWISLAVVAVLVVGFMVWRLVAGGDAKPSDKTTAADTRAEEQLEKQQTELMRKINGALNAYEWEPAIKHCAHLLGKARIDAKEDCDRARSEQEEKKRYDEAIASEMRNEHEKALQLFHGIRTGSVYYSEMQRSEVYRQAYRNYEAQAKQAIVDLVAKGECDKAREASDELKVLVPEAGAEADGKIAECKAKAQLADAQPRRVVRQRKRQPTKRQSTPDKRRGSSQKKAEDMAAAQKLLDQAWKAYREGYYTLASSLARKVLKTMPNQQALSIVGASACYLKRPAQAQSAYARLDNQRRQLLRRVCERMGVPLEE